MTEIEYDDRRDAERPYQLFGQSLARLRKEVGLARPEMARVAGVSYQMLCHLESGRRRASNEMLERLAPVLGLHDWRLRELQVRAEIDATQAKLAVLTQRLAELTSERGNQ